MKQELFGERLKKLRIQHNLTLRELAEQINVSYSTLGNYERNVREPSYDMLKCIADFFSVDVGYLLGVNPCENASNNLVVKDLGLSEDSINVIKSINDTELLNTLSRLIAHKNFIPLLEYINIYQSEFSNLDTAQLSFEKFYNSLSKHAKIMYAVENVEDYEYLMYNNLLRSFEAIINRLKF